MAPPLRQKSHQEPLWEGLRSGSLQVVATDHSARPFAGHKDQSLDDFRWIIRERRGSKSAPRFCTRTVSEPIDSP